MTRRFDAIIIGAGQAGPSLADRLTRAGMTVALIERKLFGGTCVNTGCTPTKTLVASAYAAHLARRGGEYGVVLDGPIKIDMARVKARAETVSANSRAGIEKWLRGMPGSTVIQGHARFDGPDAIRVGEERLSAPLIYINVGGRAAVPDMPGTGEVSYLTNSSILGLELVPEHLVVVGDRGPAYALYIDPPLGRVGMTVAQARATRRPLLIGERPMTRVSRAIEKGETKGFMQVVVDAETHKILGAAILGTGGDEAIHGVLDMMNAGASYATLQHAVPIHPTVSELIPPMLSEMRPAEASQQTGSSRRDARERQVALG